MKKLKQTINLLATAIIAITLTTSCSGGQKADAEAKADTEALDKKAEQDAEQALKEAVEAEEQALKERGQSEKDVDNSTEEKTSSKETPSDCDQFIKEYEEFVNGYIKIMKKMKANPSDMSVLSEYTEMMQKASEMKSNAANCTDAKYASKLMKIVSKMAQAVQ